MIDFFGRLPYPCQTVLYSGAILSPDFIPLLNTLINPKTPCTVPLLAHKIVSVDRNLFNQLFREGNAQQPMENPVFTTGFSYNPLTQSYLGVDS